MIGFRAESDPLQLLKRDGPRLLAAFALDHDQRIHHILQHRHVLKDVELLEYHRGTQADRLDRRFIGFAIVHADLIERDRPRRGLCQIINAAQQRGFTGAAWPDNRHHIAPLYRQIDPFQNRVVTIGERNIIKF